MRSTFKVLFYLKRNKKKTQSAVPLMGRITVNGTISQFSAKLTVPERLWEVRGGRAKGRSLEADRINRHLDDIRSQLDRHYRDIRDRESYVTAEKVKNAWLGFGKRYRTLLSTFRSFTDDLHGRIGVDRSKNTWYRYLATMKHLQAFLTVKYRVSDIALAELNRNGCNIAPGTNPAPEAVTEDFRNFGQRFSGAFFPIARWEHPKFKSKKKREKFCFRKIAIKGFIWPIY